MTSSIDGSQPRSMDEIERLATEYARRRDALRETVAIPADSEIDKLVAALLDGGEQTEQEAA